MVIRRLNSVFTRHGRIIFGLFTVIIIIAFMDFMQSGSAIGNFLSWFNSKNNYGEIFGEAVTPEQVIEKANRDMIITDLLFNVGINSYLAPNRAEANAFSTLGFLAAAKRRGIDASNKEIAEFIAERPKFQNKQTGKFDDKIYSAYIEKDLKNNGLSAADLDRAVREYLIISKLYEELRDSVIVTDNEIKNFYKLLNEKYYVSICRYKKSQFLKQAKATPEEAEAFFKSASGEPEEYIPGKTKILLVEFSYDIPELKKAAAAKVTPEDIKDFYNKNKKLFTKNDAGKKSVTMPFAEAKEKARQILIERYAKKIANAKAAKFADVVYDLVGDAEKSEQRGIFEDAVKQFKYKAVETAYFKDDAPGIGKINEPEIIKEVISLNEVPVSNSITGQKAAYVAFVLNRITPRPALFEEVKDKIIGKVKERKAMEMARSQARELAARLLKMDRAERLKFIATSKVPAFEILEPFSQMSPPRTYYGNIISMVSADLKSGEAAPAQNVPDGALVIVLRKRVLPAMSGLDKKTMDMLQNAYKRQKTGMAETTFTNWLQSKCKRSKQN